MIPCSLFAQTTLYPLTVEKIMRNPVWMGTSPSNLNWSADGKTLSFDWNSEKNVSDSTYIITDKNHNPIKLTATQNQDFISDNSLKYNLDRSAYTYAKDGDIYYVATKNNKTNQVTKTVDNEYSPDFSFNGQKIIYIRDQNLYAWDIASGETSQLTNFLSKEPKKDSDKLSPQEEWLKKEQVSYMEVLKERKEKRDSAKNYKERTAKKELRKIYTNDQRVVRPSINADGRYIAYQLYKSASGNKNTIVPNYITESGFTTDIPGRTKVGEAQATSTFYIYDRIADTVYSVKTDSIEGIRDIPDFIKDYPKIFAERSKANQPREISFSRSSWSPDGAHLVLDIRSKDSKDRWLMLWKPQNNSLQLLDHQRDEAWIGGPGIYNSGWIDNNTFWYQSEKTRYSHLYSVNVNTGEKSALTSGKYEVQNAQLSNDKKYFYLTTNEVDPGEHQFYRLRISDKNIERITKMTGANEVVISPDEKTIAYLYSYSNKPWELYLQDNKVNAKPQQITFKAQSDEFKSYPWRDPEIVQFAARDGATIYGRVYKPSNAKTGMPAVVFVHGAGYLQNAHKWWSSYFREYMFHNMLADNGYYVIDIDYRGSAGYGRNWRTGIYRHMGGKDLTDNVDAAAFLTRNYGVNPKAIGIYGGSYGGFMTLMAMFTTPDVFAAGAGLRSVTDWANYNHGYTSNILNEPFNDSIAYHQSSPIYFADGLKGQLLLCHGMVDENVHFQDIVKLTQRLIELKKNNWELAVYPMEDHGFVEPTSWMDEYKRIFKLFETVLK